MPNLPCWSADSLSAVSSLLLHIDLNTESFKYTS